MGATDTDQDKHESENDDRQTSTDRPLANHEEPKSRSSRDTQPDESRRKTKRALDEELDEELDDSFPASDPPSLTETPR